MKKARTIGELKKAKYRVLSVKEEIRKNLLQKLQSGQEIFSGIIGYETTVVPQLINSLIALHDIILLGERGQGKTRIARKIIDLFDREVPIIKGCEINCNPYSPICARCQRLVDKYGDDVEIEWIPPDARFGEKLATPDTTIADLIGDIDPIKVAQGRTLSDPEVIHFGLIPRVNRGVFVINELPDLPERIQVGLFNIMEERDIQIRGYKIRLPLDVLVIATANPEDYTARGRIVTPLKDRFSSVIRTHYPKSREIEVMISRQESQVSGLNGIELRFPQFMENIISEATLLARRSEEINQHSGVSVRMTISNFEAVSASAIKRAYILGEKFAVPRISDLWYIQTTSIGKIEVESFGEKSEFDILDRLVKRAIKNIFDEHFKISEFEELIFLFKNDFTFESSDMKPSKEYLIVYERVPELYNLSKRILEETSDEFFASAVEFFLESLYIYNKISKDVKEQRAMYKGRGVYVR